MNPMYRSEKVLRGKNYKGDDIYGPPELISKDYCTGFTSSGEPIIRWPEETDEIDNHGFSKKPIYGGKYIILVNLPKDTIIIRYGREDGRFTAPQGTPYENLSLPYIKESIIYNEYRVTVDDYKVYQVTQGIVAPAFNSKGGAIQYLHKNFILQDVESGDLERVNLWLS